MAAYAALVSLMQTIDDIEHHPFPPIYLDKQQVESLTQIVTFLQEFLEGYKSSVADDNEADPLEMRIANAAYAAEDVIEFYIVDVIKLGRSRSGEENDSGDETRSKSGEENDSGEETRSGFIKDVICREDVSCINLYQDPHQVIEEMDFIKKVVMNIDAEKAVVVHDNVSASADSLRSSSSSGQNSSSMVCSGDVLQGIMEKLVADQPHLQVIPIVGMGGIGKTTLAKTVYSKPLMKERFDICVWTTISQQYNSKKILCELLSQDTNTEKEDDELGLELYQYLYGRRFLIVMDDMWNVEAWEKIQRFFPNNENGSRILVTTRLSRLSSQLINNYSLQMKFLDEVSSWDLFSKTVFGKESCPLELEKIGKKIVENCRGLPLSIVVVGGLLKKMEHTKGCWESIRKNLTSVVNLENDGHCLKILKVSYNNLPIYLKPCFLYMGVFEEDSEIRVSRLIKLWVSEGFLKPMNGKSLETIAEEFFMDLVDRNLLLIDKLGPTGQIKSIKIHDLMRDLCLRESQKDGFYHVISQRSPQDINSQRRVVIPRSTSVFYALESTSHARSVICQNEEAPPCQNFGLLRTLHSSGNKNYVKSLETQYVNLRHLVVTVDRKRISSFFFSIDLLWNLQTLRVYPWVDFNAPIGIWKMPQLRHIDFFGEICLPDPSSDGRDDVVVMKNLQTLKRVRNFKCGNEVVKRIPNIKKLKTKYYGHEGTDHDDYYCLGNIKCLCKLESLYIECDDNSRGVASLHKLTFPHSLKDLILWMNSEFEWEDMLEKIGTLPLLQKLILRCGCFGTGKWEIGEEGQFPSLKYLSLGFCHGLKQWTIEESALFTRLEKLQLCSLYELKEIPFEIGYIPTLQKIELVFCSKSVVQSAKDIVDEQVGLQGDQLPFLVAVRHYDDVALPSLEGDNFEVRRISSQR